MNHYMLNTLFFLSSAWLPPIAHPYFPVSCKVAGTAKIDASGMGMTYNHRFDLSYRLGFHLEDPSRAVTIDITNEGHTSTMRGMLVNDSLIQLSVGQHIPQNFDGEGFSAALTGVVRKGFLTCTHSGSVRLFADLDASGQLLVMTLPIQVKGTIETDARKSAFIRACRLKIAPIYIPP